MIQKLAFEDAENQLREFKEHGKKIIGVFPHSLIPDELIYAANAIPIKLVFGGDDHPTTKGTEYMTQATCPFARGCIGYFDQNDPIYALVDAFIGGNFCNGDLIASEMITKFFNIPFLKVTFPTTIKPFAMKFLKQEYLILKQKLEKFTGTQITQDNLSSTIEKYNKLRLIFQNLNQQMKNTNLPLLGEDLQNLIHRFYLLGPDDTLQFIKNLEIKQNANSRNRIPILLSGSGIAYGDDLIHMIEEFDTRVVINDTWSGIHFYLEQIATPSIEDPMETLVQHYLLGNESSRMVPNVRRIPRVMKLMKEFNIKGVINHILKFCDPYIADRNRFKEHLLEADIPMLELERDYSTSLEQLKTRLGAFFEMIS